MGGFALPKLRWLVLGALAAGGWAMTQDMPSKARIDDRPARAASRPKNDATPRRETATVRPKASVGSASETNVVRPKADVARREAKAAPKPSQQKLAAAQRPKVEPSAGKPAALKKPAQSESTLRPPADLKTGSISRAPTPMPRPRPSPEATAAKAVAAKPKAEAAPQLNVLYTSTTVYLRQRPHVSAPVTSSLKQGESVRVFARDGKWTLVSSSGRKGWVHGENLRPADPGAPRPKQQLAQPG
ncbi:uncharacterized protein YgiM (DUF1202 family) [Aminobacter niigataensis]|uniref:Uncharacterized protein YgiM (DUF1202 family) n=1 Tax=Aminobacter niigataensis TaxID=83265 RepID=A0ABR6L012_9HYPH|nr:SH3 domain-containing protein [Aminobacter niigataensis]MBB4649529.1 uncharacterized protein YgiM (DUF1202 family) [Aminobacter niigataensis]